MTDPKSTTEEHWSSAEAFIRRVEMLGRSIESRDDYLGQVGRQWLAESRADASGIWMIEGQRFEVLDRQGVDLFTQEQAESILEDCRDSGSAVSAARWIDSADGRTRLVAAIRFHDHSSLGCTFRFDRPIELSRREPLKEMTEVVLELIANACLRFQNRSLRSQIQKQNTRDRWIGRLHDGSDLNESCAAITAAVAAETNCDRVSLLRYRSHRSSLIASSAQPRIDRRARQVRLLQNLVDRVLESQSEWTYVVGQPSDVPGVTRVPLDLYLDESGCREIKVEPIHDESGEPVAAIVLERFRLEQDSDDSLQRVLEPVREAVIRAFARDDAGWSFLASRISRGLAGKRFVFLVCAALLAAGVLGFAQVPLNIPVEGKTVAAQTSAVFAPSAGTVVDVLVENGMPVKKGQPMVAIRNSALDLRQKEIEGDLGAAQTQLASLSALRTRQDSKESPLGIAADRQVLETKIQGYQSQLSLLRQQIEALTLVSPMDGVVDGWNLTQSLSMRPVAQGQHLLDVASTSKGWIIELDVPDRHAGYVIRQQQHEPCRCLFTLTSGTGNEYRGVVQQIADVAQLNARGQSVVRVVVPFEESAEEFRVGATVFAQLECGNRSLGFVWFRGLVEWTRRQSWL